MWDSLPIEESDWNHNVANKGQADTGDDNHVVVRMGEISASSLCVRPTLIHSFTALSLSWSNREGLQALSSRTHCRPDDPVQTQSSPVSGLGYDPLTRIHSTSEEYYYRQPKAGVLPWLFLV